jgi:hypothetical protein
LDAAPVAAPIVNLLPWLEKRVLALSDPERLRGLHRAAILANDVAEFEQALAE